jgi:tetratricopeptide (TPR) repeat protein
MGLSPWDFQRVNMLIMLKNPGALLLGTFGVGLMGWSSVIFHRTPPEPKTASEFIEYAQEPEREPQQALQAYSKAIALNPNITEAYLGRGKVSVLEYYRQKLSEKTNTAFARNHRIHQDYKKADALSQQASKERQLVSFLYQQAVQDYNQVKIIYQEQGKQNEIAGIDQLLQKVDRNYPAHNLCFPSSSADCLH